MTDAHPDDARPVHPDDIDDVGEMFERMAELPDPDDDLGDIDFDDLVDDIDTSSIELDTTFADSIDVKELRAAAFLKSIGRYAGQLNTIDLAEAVKDQLTPLLSKNERGAILDAAVVKLGIDILSGNLRPKSLREAAQAIESLSKVSAMLQGGDASDVMNSERRQEVFAEIRMRLVSTRGQDGVEPATREALDASYVEEPRQPPELDQ